MKKATENFEVFKELLGEKDFNEIYSGTEPRTYDIVDECEDEICILQPFEFYNEGTKMLKIWTKKSGYIITEN